jgi:16S rRNA (uracil1498-N3)-methyltransferase
LRRHRVHVPVLSAGSAIVTGREAVHLGQVLRVSPGTLVRAFDGQGREADGVVVEAEPGRVVLDLGDPRESEVEADLRVTVAVSLLKGDKLSDVVRQCTELGAHAFQPLLSRHRDVPELSVNKLERLRRVAREAAKQCGRSLVPEVLEPVEPGRLEWSGVALLANPGAAATLDEFESPTREVTIVTGPEGGLAPEEVSELAGRGAHEVRLGARILRAETAPVALLAALLVPGAR